MTPYWDPVLATDGRAYEGLIQDLYASHVIKFTTICSDDVAIFFVRKKNGSLRIIVDARRPNRRFRRPPTGGIAVGERFAHRQLAEEDDIIFFRQSV